MGSTGCVATTWGAGGATISLGTRIPFRSGEVWRRGWPSISSTVLLYTGTFFHCLTSVIIITYFHPLVRRVLTSWASATTPFRSTPHSWCRRQTCAMSQITTTWETWNCFSKVEDWPPRSRRDTTCQKNLEHLRPPGWRFQISLTYEDRKIQRPVPAGLTRARLLWGAPIFCNHYNAWKFVTNAHAILPVHPLAKTIVSLFYSRELYSQVSNHAPWFDL